MMLQKFIKFPLYHDDKKPFITLNSLQKRQIELLNQKIVTNEYTLIDNPCLCENTHPKKDIVISEKDRYGISCPFVLCIQCGLIRTQKRFEEKSNIKFYNEDYRNIYVGYEFSPESFFNEQLKRGEQFFSLIEQHVNISNISNVFEIGCGAGGILYAFQQKGKKVSGCDFGKKYLKTGQEKQMFLYEGSINPSLTDYNSQDLIILSHVFEHFSNPINELNKIIEFIRDEKFLLIEVPGIFNIKQTYFSPLLYLQNAHYYNFYKSFLEYLFQEMGLSIIYSDERCTFILQKPSLWKKRETSITYNDHLSSWPKKVLHEITINHVLYSLYLHPFFIRQKISKLLTKFKIKKIFTLHRK